MELTADTIDDYVAEYPEHQPLSTVEEEHIELLPEMFADGDYGWRDAEWVVQWYGRRFLGRMPNADRRKLEAAYDENDYEDVHDAIAAAGDADSVDQMLSALTELAGVDVAIGSAFCQFIDPERYVVIDSRQWDLLCDLGALDGDYPDPPSVDDYGTYLAAYRSVAEGCECSLWELYRALWVLTEKRDEDE